MRKLLILSLVATFSFGCGSMGKLAKDTAVLTWEKKKRRPPVRVYNPIPRRIWPKTTTALTVRIPMGLKEGNLVRVFVGASGEHEVKWIDARGEICNVFWTGNSILEGYTAAWAPYGSYKTLYVVLYERCDDCPGYFRPTVWCTYEDVAVVTNTSATWTARQVLSMDTKDWRPASELPEGVRFKIAPRAFQ